jgi:ribonuclease Z
MARNLHVVVRPPKPPTLDNQPLADGKYQSMLVSSAPLALPPSTTAAFTNAKEEVSTMEIDERPSRPGDNVVIVPFGTSSAAPSQYRNGKVSVSIISDIC